MIGPSGTADPGFIRPGRRLERRRRLPPGYAWTALAAAVLGLAAAAQAGWLMRAVLLDLASLWPGWAITIAPLFIRRRIPGAYRRAARLGPAAAAPLILLVWLLIGASLHLAGWRALPSAAGSLAGPSVEDGPASAALDIETSGAVELDGAARRLYEVHPMRSGGPTAPARSSEVWTDGAAAVRLREGPDPGWFGSAGWRASISAYPRWTVAVRAALLEADFTGVAIDSLRVQADGGRVRLGGPSGEVAVDIDGRLTLEVPWDATVELIGPGRVGPGWAITAAGRQYIGEGGTRYLIRAAADSDLAVEQWRQDSRENG